eukprot:11258772-Prorocentrum_lima.AAC.1
MSVLSLSVTPRTFLSFNFSFEWRADRPGSAWGRVRVARDSVPNGLEVERGESASEQFAQQVLR